MKLYLRLQKPALFALGLGMAAMVWTMDRLAPAQASFSAFYLLPVGFVAWFCGEGWGYVMAALTAAAWLQGDLADGIGYSDWWIPYWNAFIHLILFVLMSAMSGVLTRQRRLYEVEHEMSELKSDLVSLVSHEFGNSLTTLRLSLTILEESEGAAPSSQRQMCYATLHRVYAHLSNATANFLNLNRIEAGRFSPHLRRTPLRTLVHATIAQLGAEFETKHVELKLDFPAQHVVVNADPDALSVVMSNLIGNAFKYTPVGGSVTVRIAADDAAGTARVSVEDTGIGISKADLKRITTGYYRSEGGRQAAKGFGVGLKVARELLDSQGSRLEIESEVGRGSSFSFRVSLWK
ncbi:MAG: sensor histidine kinase [Elusimicrobiota bacterium]